jgi:hypothetical protein
LSYVCDDVSREEEDDDIERVKLELEDGVGVMVELELKIGVVVIVTWEGITSIIEYPVVVTVAAGGVTVTRTV